MILAFDTYYYENKAKTVAVGFRQWSAEKPEHIQTEIIEGVAEYEPGAFYKRELPCILSLLERYNLDEITCIVVDGYVVLDDAGKWGLGGYLFEAVKGAIPIIGVAKSKFSGNENNAMALLRGNSQKPLYISAKGIDLTIAHQYVGAMHGPYRMPTLLQILDTETKCIAD